MTTEIQRCLDQITDVIAPMLVSAGVGYLCARVFLTINPIHAAVFSASASLISRVIAPIFEETFGGWAANDASRISGRLLGIGTAIALSAAISTVLGFSMSFNSGLVLTGTIFAVTISAAIAVDFVKRNRFPVLIIKN